MATTNWQIAFRGIVSAGVIVPNTAMGFVLKRQGESSGFPCFFAAAALVGANLSALFNAKGPFRSFTTKKELDPSDFSCWGSVLCASAGGIVVGQIGGVIINLNFWPIVHTPNPVACDSTAQGVGLGGGWMPGRFIVIPTSAVAVQASGQPATDDSIVEVLDDSDDLPDEMAGLFAAYLQNNTDPDYMT
jgi:hypothetical protein